MSDVQLSYMHIKTNNYGNLAVLDNCEGIGFKNHLKHYLRVKFPYASITVSFSLRKLHGVSGDVVLYNSFFLHQNLGKVPKQTPCMAQPVMNDCSDDGSVGRAQCAA